MKIEIKNEGPKEFKPVKIEIIIENEDQLQTLFQFTQWNETVPALFNNGKHRDIMKKLMNDLRDLTSKLP